MIKVKEGRRKARTEERSEDAALVQKGREGGASLEKVASKKGQGKAGSSQESKEIVEEEMRKTEVHERMQRRKCQPVGSPRLALLKERLRREWQQVLKVLARRYSNISAISS
eukprot:4850676-Pleurochrysis_carterae.AAC.1